MEESKIIQVKRLLYDFPDEEVMSIISSTDDIELLYTYLYNYNWDDGFEIPQMILDNEKCDLSTALLAFYGADGAAYLQNKLGNENLPKWKVFIKKLYDCILKGKYVKGQIAFKVPLSKVQIFNLRKILSEDEKVFIENIVGKDLDINV